MGFVSFLIKRLAKKTAVRKKQAKRRKRKLPKVSYDASASRDHYNRKYKRDGTEYFVLRTKKENRELAKVRRETKKKYWLSSL